jgi:deoxyribodipyrimidine photo-lyase
VFHTHFGMIFPMRQLTGNIQAERIKQLNTKDLKRGRYILYWMQSAQRVEYNHALVYATEKANERKKPLLVIFALTSYYPEANLRHYWFMLEGLKETQESLEKKGVKMVIAQMSPAEAAIEFSKDAELVVVDAGQLRIQRKWRAEAAKKVTCRVTEIETNLIVPVTEASEKEEFAARTIRPRIYRKLDYYMVQMKHSKTKVDSLGLRFSGLDISDTNKAISKLKIDKSVGRCSNFIGGTSQAKKLLRNFIREKLKGYAELRNEPSLDYQSNMGPYLHFGQVSPLYIALEISKSQSKAKKDYLEELIIRRELSHNFVYYNKNYDKFDCLEPWAKRTLNFHRRDRREYVYTLKQLEQAKTHDEYWNAAQREMMLCGKMHGYMRMYWGKKILQWSRTPQEGFKNALYLNNRYELDGRGANAFAGVAWCFGKHDQAWPERKVFGKVRYMNAAGLKRKFDMQAYVEKVNKTQRKLKQE